MFKSFLTYATIFYCTFLHAGITGSLKGKIIDIETGDPFIGCYVIILVTELGAATDLDGNYKIIKIPPGNYKIQVIMIALNIAEKKNLSLF